MIETIIRWVNNLSHPNSRVFDTRGDRTQEIAHLAREVVRLKADAARKRLLSLAAGGASWNSYVAAQREYQSAMRKLVSAVETEKKEQGHVD